MRIVVSLDTHGHRTCIRTLTSARVGEGYRRFFEYECICEVLDFRISNSGRSARWNLSHLGKGKHYVKGVESEQDAAYA